MCLNATQEPLNGVAKKFSGKRRSQTYSAMSNKRRGVSEFECELLQSSLKFSNEQDAQVQALRKLIKELIKDYMERK